MSIQLHHDAAAVTVNHTLRNDNGWPVQLCTVGHYADAARWHSHFSATDRTARPRWPFAQSRPLSYGPMHAGMMRAFRPSADVIRVVGAAQPVAFKMGMMNRHGWLALHARRYLFPQNIYATARPTTCRFGLQQRNLCQRCVLELETLGPLVTLQPGASVSHNEVWELFSAENLACLYNRHYGSFNLSHQPFTRFGADIIHAPHHDDDCPNRCSSRRILIQAHLQAELLPNATTADKTDDRRHADVDVPLVENIGHELRHDLRHNGKQQCLEGFGCTS